MKSRSFVVTQWNVNLQEDEYRDIMKKNSIQYIAYGLEECPTTGRQHHQLFMYYTNPQSTSKSKLNKIGNLWGPIHARVEVMRGSFEQNEAYCAKDGHYTKLGKEPKQGLRGDLNEVKDMIMSGDMSVDKICCEAPVMVHQYGRTLDRLEDIALRRKYRTEMTKGIWYYGPTGVGKSHKAFEDFDPDTVYVKNLNESWWDGYKGQQKVIFNEFRGQVTFGELLDLCDKYPKTVSRRGREPVPFLATELVVTSSMSPYDIYTNVLNQQERIEQLERRFVIVKMEQKCPEGNIETSGPT